VVTGSGSDAAAKSSSTVGRLGALRLASEQVDGSALTYQDVVVHLVAFPAAKDRSAPQPPMWPRVAAAPRSGWPRLMRRATHTKSLHI